MVNSNPYRAAEPILGRNQVYQRSRPQAGQDVGPSTGEEGRRRLVG